MQISNISYVVDAAMTAKVHALKTTTQIRRVVTEKQRKNYCKASKIVYSINFATVKHVLCILIQLNICLIHLTKSSNTDTIQKS